MHALKTTFAGLALAAGLTGCDQPNNWTCEIDNGGIYIRDPANKNSDDLYWAFNTEQSRNVFTGIQTLKSKSVWANDAASFSGKAPQSNASIAVTIGPGRKVESCMLWINQDKYTIASARIRPSY